MAAEKEEKIGLKLYVDKEKNRVVFAEADNDFIDVLFSFLTMPLGTIVRLSGKQSQALEIGSLTNLYKGLVDFDTSHLWNESCKTMLLHPANSAEAFCRRLKLNIDDTEPTKYFICHHYYDSCHKKRRFVSTQKDQRCSACSTLMTKEVNLKDLDINGVADRDGVFVHGKPKYMITDDLEVMPISTAYFCTLLSNLGITNMNGLYTREVNIGLQKTKIYDYRVCLQEISRILNLSAVSMSPLTDMFLREQGFNPFKIELKPNLQPQGQRESPSNIKNMTLKLILRKSESIILYAEARDDFVDFLFSFLTLPLGTTVELLNGNSMLGCIDNLYRSVGDMNVGELLASEGCKSMLLHPKPLPQLSCKNQPLDVKEAVPYYCADSGCVTFNQNASRPTLTQLEFIDPKKPTGSSTSTRGGYVKGPAIFMVTDNLLVKPLSWNLCIDFLNNLNVPITDLDERVVHVGKEEALCILKASLISDKALNVGLNLIAKKIKQEV